MKAVDIIKRVMAAEEVKWSEGCVYKKLVESKYTYRYGGKVEDYLLTLLDDATIAEVLLPSIEKLSSLLSKPSCGLLPCMPVDLNYIEVLPYGTCFDIPNRKFVKDPADLKGTPRAYVRYTYIPGKRPFPKPFVEGVCNSINRRDRRKFYQKYYQLLLPHMFPMKETKLLLVGPSDSGKTSWFEPFQGTCILLHELIIL